MANFTNHKHHYSLEPKMFLLRYRRFSSQIFCVIGIVCAVNLPNQMTWFWIQSHKIVSFNVSTFFTLFSSFLFCLLFSFDRIFLQYDFIAKVTKVSGKMPKCFFQCSISYRLGFSGSGEIAHFSNFIWRQMLYRSRRCLRKSCDCKNFGTI